MQDCTGIRHINSQNSNGYFSLYRYPLMIDGFTINCEDAARNIGVLVYIASKAAYEAHDYRLKSGKIVHLKRGQLVMSYRTVAEALHIPSSTLHDLVRRFRTHGFIETEHGPDRACTIVTVLNTALKSPEDFKSGQLSDNSRTALGLNNKENKKNNNVYSQKSKNQFGNFPQREQRQTSEDMDKMLLCKHGLGRHPPSE